MVKCSTAGGPWLRLRRGCRPRCVLLLLRVLLLLGVRHVLQFCAALMAFRHGWLGRLWCRCRGGKLHCSRGLAKLRMAWGWVGWQR